MSLLRRHIKPSAGGPSNGLLNNLVSYWKLDESSGNALDAHGSNDGTVSGATQGATGKINTAYSFDGNDEINFGANPTNLEPGVDQDFTISLWFKTSTSSFEYFIGKGGQTTTSAGIGYGLAHNSGAVYGFIHDGTRLILNQVGSGYNDGTWHLYIGEFDRSGNFTPTVDNVELGTTDISARNGSLDGSETLYIGRFGAAGGKLTGSVDEVGFWNTLLTGDQKTSLYNSGSGLSYDSFTS